MRPTKRTSWGPLPAEIIPLAGSYSFCPAGFGPGPHDSIDGLGLLFAGIPPRFQTYTGADPLADVISWNLKRRHLSTSQKAVLAVSLKPMFAEQARERQAATRITNGHVPARANLPTPERARDQAAAAVGVSGRIAQDAEYVKKRAPEVAVNLYAGKRTVRP